jgi:hypothetical protein
MEKIIHLLNNKFSRIESQRQVFTYKQNRNKNLLNKEWFIP